MYIYICNTIINIYIERERLGTWASFEDIQYLGTWVLESGGPTNTGELWWTGEPPLAQKRLRQIQETMRIMIATQDMFDLEKNHPLHKNGMRSNNIRLRWHIYSAYVDTNFWWIDHRFSHGSRWAPVLSGGICRTWSLCRDHVSHLGDLWAVATSQAYPVGSYGF